MISSKIFINLSSCDASLLDTRGSYLLVFSDGGCVDVSGAPLSSGACVVRCSDYCARPGVVSCSFHLRDGRCVASAVVV